MFEFFSEHTYLLAVAIFFSRVLDVSIGTTRTILVIRGHRYLAAALGFFEVTIWMLAAGQVITNLEEWYLIVCYAGGFATGNIVGIWLESRLAIGSELIRAVSENLDVDLARELRALGYAVTALPGKGEGNRPVEVIYVVERRRHVPALIDTLTRLDPEAIFTRSDVKAQPRNRAVFRMLTNTGLKRK